MRITDPIFSLVWDISDFFWVAYREVRDWIWPFNLLATPLRAISDAFWALLTPIAALGEWTINVDISLSRMLTWSDLTDWMFDLMLALLPIITWINNATSNVQSIVNNWWSGTSWTVRSWIDSAVAGFQALINQVAANLATLQSTWDNFWTLTWPAMIADLGDLRSSWTNFLTVTLPGLASWSEIQSVVNSTLTSWLPFRDDLAAMWPAIALFFTNPLDYLAARLETWFWGES